MKSRTWSDRSKATSEDRGDDEAQEARFRKDESGYRDFLLAPKLED